MFAIMHPHDYWVLVLVFISSFVATTLLVRSFKPEPPPK